MLKLTSLSLIFLLTFSQKAYSYMIDIFQQECGMISIETDDNYGLSKSDVERYYYIYDFWSFGFRACDNKNLLLTKNLKDSKFLDKFANRINIAKEKLKFFDNYPPIMNEISSVIINEKRRVELGIWLQEIRLEFFKTGDINVLRKSYLGVLPSKEILDIIDNIATLKDDMEICNKSCHEFHEAWYSYYYLTVHKKIYNEEWIGEPKMEALLSKFEQKYKMKIAYFGKDCD
jgi:hypothetical protein